MLHRKALFSAATIVAVMTAAPLALAQSSSTAGSGISANTAIGTPSSGYGSNGGTSSSRPQAPLLAAPVLPTMIGTRITTAK